jgi:Putative phage abortive infection protein
VEDKFREKVSTLTEHNVFAKEITERYGELEKSPSENEAETKRLATAFIRQSFDQSDWPTREHLYTRLTQTYNEMYSEHEHQLDAYFRTLYRIFELLSRGKTDYALSDKQVREYAAIARAQLSWQELAFVLLNCCAANFERAGKLYSQFALFDNLADRSSIVTTLLRKYVEADKSGATYLAKPGALSDLTHHAFDTDKARKLA